MNNFFRLHLAVVLLLSMAFAIGRAAAASDADIDARAKAIHQRVLSIDSHVDVLLPNTPSRYYGKDGKSAAELSKLRQGGVDAIALAIAVGPGPRTPQGDAEARAEADQKLKSIQLFLKENSQDAALALNADDIVRIHSAGKVAIIESFLNARSLAGNVAAIDDFYKAGVRLFGLTHAGNNDFADSSRPTGEPFVEHHGLSALGEQAVVRLNRLGVIIDVSQLTQEGVLQAIKLSKAPVVASHSDVRALVNNGRNLSDRELDAIKLNGGVVHVTPFNAYLVPLPDDFYAKVKALRAEYGVSADFKGEIGYTVGLESLSPEQQSGFYDKVSALLPRATLSNYVDHIDYIVRRIGVDHVGIGSDFNHGAGIAGFQDESEALNVTRELVRRGYTEQQIAAIWGGNFLRVFREVEAVSRKLQSS